MIKFFTLFLFFFSSFQVLAQTPAVRPARYTSLSLLYGSKFLLKDPFQKQLNSFAHYKANGPLTTVGVAFGLGRRWGFGNARTHAQVYTFSRILKGKINFGDTLTATLTGYQVGCGLYGFILKSKNNRSNLQVSLGFNAGRLKLSNSKTGDRLNPFFSPKITLRPYFNFDPVYVALTVEYEYDLSKAAWKAGKGASQNGFRPAALSQTGISALLNLGIFIF